MKSTAYSCTAKAKTPAATLAKRIRGLERVTVVYGRASVKRNGRRVTVAEGQHGDVLDRLAEACALLQLRMSVPR